MRHALTGALVTLVCVVAFAGDGQIRRAIHPVKDSYVVAFNNTSDIDAAMVSDDLKRTHGVKVHHVYDRVLRGCAILANEAQARRISADARVRSVWEDESGTPTGIQSGPSWGLDRIDQRTLPLNLQYIYNFNGSGVTVYVLDSGVTPTLAEFGSRVVRNYKLRADSPDFYDHTPTSHGTAVASLIGGTTYGVAKQVSIINVKVFADDGFTFAVADLIAGLNTVMTDHETHPGPAVANVSGILPINGSLDAAVMNLINQGVTFVTGAGNSRADACNYSPAHLGNPSQWPNNPNAQSAITVAGSTAADEMWQDSNWGPCVDVFAPAENVSALDRSGGENPVFGGTSAASPHVAGVAALHAQRLTAAFGVEPTPGVVQAAIIDGGTANVLNPATVPAGTPNLLLYSLTSRQRACCAY